MQHHSLLNDVLALLVLLTLLVRNLVLPSQKGAARSAEDIAHRVQASHQHAVFSAAQRNVGHVVEQIRASVASLKRLRHESRDDERPRGVVLRLESKTPLRAGRG